MDESKENVAKETVTVTKVQCPTTPTVKPAKIRTESPVILHADVDAFECQVYQRLRPDLKDIPLVVAQSGGRIVSVNYEAKKVGITRDMRAQQARKACPNIKVISILDHPIWGKSDKKTARYASREILDEGVLPYKKTHSPEIIVNFSSCDEFFIDVSDLVTARMKEDANPLPSFAKLGPKTFLEAESTITEHELQVRVEKTYRSDLRGNKYVNYGDEARLMYGAIIAQEISEYIWRGTKFNVSVGVGHNILTAKLGTSLHKPKGITVLAPVGLDRVAKYIKISDIPGLGGPRGKILSEVLSVNSMRDLQSITAAQIVTCFGGDKNGENKNIIEFAEKVVEWSHGIDTDIVEEKLYKDRINCGKTFPQGFITYNEFCQQCIFLIEEIMERIDEEKYRIKGITRLPVNLRIEVEVWDRETSRFARSGFSFPWHDVTGPEIWNAAIEGIWDSGFNPESLRYRDTRTLKFVVTKLERMTDAQHAALEHHETSTCKIFRRFKDGDGTPVKGRRLGLFRQ